MLALWIHVVLMLTVMVGIAVRERWRATLAFPVYLLFGLVHNTLHAVGILGPGNWLPWLVVELLQGLLALGVAVEIAARMFHQRLPGAHAWTERVVLLVLSLGLLAAVLWALHMRTVQSDVEFYRALVEAARLVAATSLWTFVALFWLALSRFGWPVDAYHRDVALGFAVYRVALLLASPGALGSAWLPPSWPVWVYGAVLLLWLWAAWRPPDLARVAPAYRSLVWPWLKRRDPDPVAPADDDHRASRGRSPPAVNGTHAVPHALSLM